MGAMLQRVGLLESGGGGGGGGESDPHFASVVLLVDWSDRGTGTDDDFASVVLISEGRVD